MKVARPWFAARGPWRDVRWEFVRPLPTFAIFGVALQHSALSPQTAMLFAKGLKKAAELFGGTVPWSSRCSGQGVEIHVLKGLDNFCWDNLDVRLTRAHDFVCESAVPLQQHLQSHFFPSDKSTDPYIDKPILYSDLTSLSEFGNGVDIIDGFKKQMPTTSQGFTRQGSLHEHKQPMR